MPLTLPRVPVKFVRDFIKKDYTLRDKCYICASTDKLELHHIYSLSEVFHNWCDKHKIKDITSVDQIKKLRVIFYEDELDKLTPDNLYTLCKPHHEKLHNIYGQRYSNIKAAKVLNWLNKMREKHSGE